HRIAFTQPTKMPRPSPARKTLDKKERMSSLIIGMPLKRKFRSFEAISFNPYHFLYTSQF
ncbi:MAG: hypothetical protein DRQ89_14365, partial [Epsilonproteobacteria bacterium]